MKISNIFALHYLEDLLNLMTLDKQLCCFSSGQSPLACEAYGD